MDNAFKNIIELFNKYRGDKKLKIMRESTISSWDSEKGYHIIHRIAVYRMLGEFHPSPSNQKFLTVSTNENDEVTNIWSGFRRNEKSIDENMKDIMRELE